MLICCWLGVNVWLVLPAAGAMSAPAMLRVLDGGRRRRRDSRPDHTRRKNLHQQFTSLGWFYLAGMNRNDNKEQ